MSGLQDMSTEWQIKKGRQDGWKPVSLRGAEQRGETDEWLTGGRGGGGGSLGAHQGHCAFHRARSATQTPPPLSSCSQTHSSAQLLKPMHGWFPPAGFLSRPCETHTTAVCLEYTDRVTNQGRWEVFREEGLKKSFQGRETGFNDSKIEWYFFFLSSCGRLRDDRWALEDSRFCSSVKFPPNFHSNWATPGNYWLYDTVHSS